VRFSDEEVCIGPAPSAESYLNIPRIIAAAEITGAQAIHPGYGFLAENAEFAEICERSESGSSGRPRTDPRHGRQGHRPPHDEAGPGFRTVPGSPGVVHDPKEALRLAREIGFPIMIKASAGGGGKGMRVAPDVETFEAVCAPRRTRRRRAFGDPSVYLERFIERPRHVEIQVFGDTHGRVVHLGERDCSIQRRHQKLIEEAPSPAVSLELREEMGSAAVRAAESIGYEGAGTSSSSWSRTAPTTSSR
jgi:acetyl-CoA carboxylase, biotin carboxylase subunit